MTHSKVECKGFVNHICKFSSLVSCYHGSKQTSGGFGVLAKVHAAATGNDNAETCTQVTRGDSWSINPMGLYKRLVLPCNIITSSYCSQLSEATLSKIGGGVW
ncbi:unnamed protein product [Eruca vesicaria subsp. sativa]|uniref:Uncharacterized protein n=1 Tax=Eruca vesicaria subsp. sativa TaxID=29727 RepID=A0ABC8LT85_ERUVS|nr:unnamed protein product [Eruca vesicaria subsp. sativa]